MPNLLIDQGPSKALVFENERKLLAMRIKVNHFKFILDVDVEVRNIPICTLIGILVGFEIKIYILITISF